MAIVETHTDKIWLVYLPDDKEVAIEAQYVLDYGDVLLFKRGYPVETAMIVAKFIQANIYGYKLILE